MDINAILNQSNKFCIELTTIDYFKGSEVEIPKGLSWLNNMPYKKYIELVRNYPFYFNQTLYIKLVSKTLEDLLI